MVYFSSISSIKEVLKLNETSQRSFVMHFLRTLTNKAGIQQIFAFTSWNVTPSEAQTKEVSIIPTVNNRGKAKPNKTSQAQVQELLMSTSHTEPIAGGLTTAELDLRQ